VSSPQVCLNDVLITDRLPFRPVRTNTYESVTNALIALSAELARKPEDVFQRLAQYALNLCRAGSAGISVLEADGNEPHFRWYAIAGTLACYTGETMGLNSPCGTVVETNKAALFRRPETFFAHSIPISPPVEEALLVPFRVDDTPRGTLWAISHCTNHQFDTTDLTILTDLSELASSAYRILVQSDYLAGPR
jgi:GAF domain-containing protein